jgi:hypothetical protein
MRSIVISIMMAFLSLAAVAGNLTGNTWINCNLETQNASSTAGAPDQWVRGGNDWGTDNATPMATFWSTDTSVSSTHSLKIVDQSATASYSWFSTAQPVLSGTTNITIRWNWKGSNITGGNGGFIMWWQQENDSGVIASGVMQDSTGNNIIASGTFNWTEKTATLPVVSGATRLRLSFETAWWVNGNFNTSATGTLWIDNVSVAPWPTTLQANFGFTEPVVTRSDIGLTGRQIMNFDFMGITNTSLVGYKGTDYYDTMLLEMSIAGMINRSEPLIWLGQQSWGWTHGESTWLSHYANTRKYNFVTLSGGVDALLQRCAHVFNGIVLYDPTPSDNIFLAANIANQNFCLPVSINLYNAHKASFGNLQVVLYIGPNTMTRTQVYDWLIANVLPNCDRTGVYSAGSTFNDITLGYDWCNYILGFDYAFYHKFFIYNISCVSSNTAWSTVTISGSSAMKTDNDQIMAALTAPAFVCGWLEPEFNWCQAASAKGHYIANTAVATNLSFHAGVTPVNPPPYVQDTGTKKRLPENKVYLAYFTNEGDTTVVLSQVYYRAWLDSSRGQLPMTWGIGPEYAKHFPAMVEYYYQTKTDNDYFMTPPSGAGYHYPMYSNNWAGFCQYTEQMYNNFFTEREVDLWWSTDSDADVIAANMPSIRGILMSPDNSDPYGRLSYTAKRHIPVIRRATNMQYWMTSDKPFWDANANLNYDVYANHLNTVYANVPKPWYLPAYGLQDRMVGQIVDFVKTRLDPNKFEVIDYGTMMHLAGLPSGTVDWNDNYVQQAGVWTALMNGALVTSSASGLRVEIAPGKTWAIAAIPNVLLPQGSKFIRVKVSACTGTDWIAKMTGDWNQTGGVTDWLPFGTSTAIGEFAMPLSSSVLFDLDRRPLSYLQLGLEGTGGSYVEFESVDFNSTPGDVDGNGKVNFADLATLSNQWLCQKNLYIESLGQVNIEAERYTATTSVNGRSWNLCIGNGSSGQCMRVEPNTGITVDANIIANTPRISYAVNFNTVGTYYLWTKGRGPTGATGTIHYGVDGAVISSSGSNCIWFSSSFGWTLKPITIASAGIHTIDYWMRRDGVMLDKMILTTNGSYIPSQVIEPSESPYQFSVLNGDLNSDGLVNMTDLAVFGGNWLFGAGL